MKFLPDTAMLMAMCAGFYEDDDNDFDTNTLMALWYDIKEKKRKVQSRNKHIFEFGGGREEKKDAETSEKGSSSPFFAA
eukprot:15360224-Ditylum_brightwellii.AAC.1